MEEMQIETRPQPRKAILSFTEYTLLNEKLSKLESYPKAGTNRLWPMYPELVKVDQTFDTEGNEVSFDIMCAADIGATLQESYPEIFENLTLVESWEVENYEGELDLLELEGLTTEQIDWFLENVNDQWTYKDGQMIIIGDEQPSTLEIVESIVNKGLNIGIYENN